MPAQALRAFLNIDLPLGYKRWNIEMYKAMVQAIFLQTHYVLIKVL
jgi:hypothetical protein